jgi:hypothetical protein
VPYSLTIAAPKVVCITVHLLKEDSTNTSNTCNKHSAPDEQPVHHHMVTATTINSELL